MHLDEEYYWNTFDHQRNYDDQEEFEEGFNPPIEMDFTTDRYKENNVVTNSNCFDDPFVLFDVV